MSLRIKDYHFGCDHGNPPNDCTATIVRSASNRVLAERSLPLVGWLVDGKIGHAWYHYCPQHSVEHRFDLIKADDTSVGSQNVIDWIEEALNDNENFRDIPVILAEAREKFNAIN